MNETYARQVLKAGRDLGITDRGIVIGFATVFVESDWIMYANAMDPATLSYPHDALSRDADSSGLFQQRPPWWGTAADRMDPYKSAVLFFTALKKLDYNNASHSPGWYAQQVQQSAFPDRYDQHIPDAQALFDRVNRPSEKAMEKVLNYPRGKQGDYDGIAQTKPWDCGPASVQAILSAAGVLKSEDWIISEANSYLAAGDQIGVNGTNHAGLLCPLLNRLLPGSGYTEVWVPQANQQAVETFWVNAKRSLDAGRGVLLNFEVPPWQGVKTSRGSKPPPYPTGSTTFHYTAGMGYAVDSDGSRHIWVADPAAFGGITGYWVEVSFLVLLIVPHAYAYAAAAYSSATSPAPQPIPAPAVDLSDKLTRLWTEWNALEFGDLDAIAIIAQAAKGGDARATYALGKLEQINPTALKAFIARKAA